jgi:hypothetical protein
VRASSTGLGRSVNGVSRVDTTSEGPGQDGSSLTQTLT